MRNVIPVFSLVLLAACKGGEPTPVGPSAYSFKDASAPDSVEADVPLATVDGWDAAVGLLGMTDLITTEALVRELLGSSADPTPICWIATAPNSLTIRLDYGACGPLQASGIIVAARQSIGQAVAYESQSFNFKNRQFATGEVVMTPSGSSRFLTAGAVWTDAANPPTTPITLAVDGRMLDIDLTGRARLNPLANEIIHWGSMMVTGDEGTQEVWFGATDAEQANGESEPDAALTDPLLDTCWCATTGTIALPTTLMPTAVNLDLNRSLEDGGTVWPIIRVEPTDTVEGVLMVEPGNQCGRLRGSFVPNDGESLVITGAQLQAGVDLACTNNAFGSEEACQQIQAAAAEVSEHTVNLEGERVNSEMVKEMVERLMDAGFCEAPAVEN